MDKFEKIAEILEDPGKYSDQEIETLLQDPETRDFYNIICDADSSLHPAESLAPEDVEREWQRFRRINLPKRHRLPAGFLRRRIAVVGAIAISSVAALAIGISLIHTKTTAPKTADQFKGNSAGLSANPDSERIIIGKDSVSAKMKSVIFENEPLDTILSIISSHYRLGLDIRGKEVGKLRLYYKWEQDKKPEDVISQLDSFEKINVSLSDGKIIVE